MPAISTLSLYLTDDVVDVSTFVYLYPTSRVPVEGKSSVYVMCLNII